MAFKYTIRNFVPDDYRNAVKLWRTAGIYNPKTDKKGVILRKHRQNKKLIVVAEAYKMVIGTVLGIGDGWRGSLWRLAVHPEYQNKGVGARLISSIKGLGTKDIQSGFTWQNRFLRSYIPAAYNASLG